MEVPEFCSDDELVKWKQQQDSKTDPTVPSKQALWMIQSKPSASRAYKKHNKAKCDYSFRESNSESIYFVDLKKNLSPCQVVVPNMSLLINLHVVSDQKYQPYVVLKYHSLTQQPYTFLASQFSEMIQDLYIMANNWQNLNKTNRNTKTGSMFGIGYCQGTDWRYCAGICSSIPN